MLKKQEVTSEIANQAVRTLAWIELRKLDALIFVIMVLLLYISGQPMLKNQTAPSVGDISSFLGILTFFGTILGYLKVQRRERIKVSQDSRLVVLRLTTLFENIIQLSTSSSKKVKNVLDLHIDFSSTRLVPVPKIFHGSDHAAKLEEMVQGLNISDGIKKATFELTVQMATLEDEYKNFSTSFERLNAESLTVEDEVQAFNSNQKAEEFAGDFPAPKKIICVRLIVDSYFRVAKASQNISLLMLEILESLSTQKTLTETIDHDILKMYQEALKQFDNTGLVIQEKLWQLYLDLNRNQFERKFAKLRESVRSSNDLDRHRLERTG